MWTPLINEIMPIVLPASAGGLLFFLMQETAALYRKRKDKRTREWIALSFETRYELARRKNLPPDFSDNAEVERLCDAWVKLRGMTLEDKLLVLRAGYSPENARNILRTLGKEALQVQAVLAGR